MISIGSLLIFTNTPDDYVQGISAKIMYIHVPSAWLALLIYFFMVLASIGYLVYGNSFFSLLTYSLSLTGLLFNFLCIATGMIWAKLTWGVWWVWDVRLISVAILLLFYIFYIAIYNSNNKNYEKISAAINIIGAINLPIIKFSVELWNNVHQSASILRAGGVSIHHTMLYQLIIMFTAFVIFSIITVSIKLHSCLIEKKINHLALRNMND